jgi:hypothetical protein
VKTITQKIFGLLNVLISGTVTAIATEVYRTGIDMNSRCEYCSLMIYPAIGFGVFVLIGLFTLFCPMDVFNKQKTLLDILNVIGILLSVVAVLVNFLASS